MVKIELSCRRQLDLDLVAIHFFKFFAEGDNLISGVSCRRELNFDDLFMKTKKNGSVCELSTFEGCLSEYYDIEVKSVPKFGPIWAWLGSILDPFWWLAG